MYCCPVIVSNDIFCSHTDALKSIGAKLNSRSPLLSLNNLCRKYIDTICQYSYTLQPYAETGGQMLTGQRGMSTRRWAVSTRV